MIADAICLIAISVVVGYLLERAYTWVAKFITSWPRLLLVIGSLYLAIGSTLVILHTQTDNQTELAALLDVIFENSCLQTHEICQFAVWPAIRAAA